MGIGQANKTIVESKWIFKIKYGFPGLEKFKCKEGYSQVHSIDFNNVLSFVVNIALFVFYLL